MASAQVLPGSRKQEHLEAGKRRLEEFRKKKAAEKAKKAASTTQPQVRSEIDHVRITDVDGVGTSGAPFTEITNNNSSSIGKETEFSHESQPGFSHEIHASSSVLVDNRGPSSAEFVRHPNNIHNGPLDVISSLGTKQIAYDFLKNANAQDMAAHTHEDNHSTGVPQQASQGFDNKSSSFSFSMRQESTPGEKDNSLRVSSAVSNIFSQDYHSKLSSQNSVESKPSGSSSLGNDYAFSNIYADSVQSTTNMGGSILEVKKPMLYNPELRDPTVSNLGEKNIGNSAGGFLRKQSSSMQISEPSGFSFDSNSSSHIPLYPATSDASSCRSHPSFLDSLNVSKASPGPLFQHSESGNNLFAVHSSQASRTDVSGSSPFQKPSLETGIYSSKPWTFNTPSSNEKHVTSFMSAGNGGEPLKSSVHETSMDKKHDFYAPQKNEDFAALEQHIQDLTLEKFSLQRALEASRALAESLAAENSSLTDNYNQQRSNVNQLKSDMENLQEEINARLAELESFKMEYLNARLECTAADERANILASEVIGLEEKTLRLRSNELRLERQLENTQAEISSFKKKMSSLEKERQDLQSTIEALQEEKKLMQSKLRKASASGKSIDVIKSPISRKDMSTWTEDLDATSATSNEEMQNSTLLGASSSTMESESGELSIEALSVIPPDQMRMIQNINALISELALEKEELTRALSSDISQSSKLKELNKELSQKLEAQTQRLELLTAQRMAGENISVQQPDSHTANENTTYADEGDEVVERVLGWIMKLFPGGPSLRRTSKLL